VPGATRAGPPGDRVTRRSELAPGPRAPPAHAPSPVERACRRRRYAADPALVGAAAVWRVQARGALNGIAGYAARPAPPTTNVVPPSTRASPSGRETPSGRSGLQARDRRGGAAARRLGRRCGAPRSSTIASPRIASSSSSTSIAAIRRERTARPASRRPRLRREDQAPGLERKDLPSPRRAVPDPTMRGGVPRLRERLRTRKCSSTTSSSTASGGVRAAARGLAVRRLPVDSRLLAAWVDAARYPGAGPADAPVTEAWRRATDGWGACSSIRWRKIWPERSA